jgi:4-amino-4-deoxy-L-arabinose transferase-like glycosyltransferase
MKLFGVGEFAARFPNAAVGITTLVVIYYAGKRVVNERLATWWAVLYVASWLPHFYFKTGIIDPTFNLFIFLSFFQVWLLRASERKWLHAILTGLFLGLAVLTKGPVAVLIAVLVFVAYIVASKGLNGYKIGHLLVIALCAMVPVALWLGSTFAKYGAPYGKWFLSEFIQYQVRLFSTEDADHGGPFFYHFVVLLVGCFPASAFLFQYFRKKDRPAAIAPDFTRWMWLLFWVVLILFSIVQTKIVHYSSLCYFPLTYLAALQLYRLSNGTTKVAKGVTITIVALSAIMAIVIGALPVVGLNKQQLVPLIHDPFAVANLDAPVAWSYAECLWGLIYFVAVCVAVAMMKKNFRRGLLVLCVTQIIIIQATILHFTPKIEAYSQRSAIEYFKRFEGQNVYVTPLGYKSYANLFYTKKQPPNSPSYVSVRVDKNGKDLQPEANSHWLLHGAVDRPTYFICKIQDKPKYDTMQELANIGGSNGFVFYKRK